MRARIVERTRQDGGKRYIIQTRFLFWWFDNDYDYGSMAEAKKKMCFYDGTKVVDRVIEEDSHREPDPSVVAIVAKLRDVFKARLDKENDPESFLEGMKPMVAHERRELIPLVVNESPSKLYIFDSPVRGGKSIFVDGEFARKILVMGDLP